MTKHCLVIDIVNNWITVHYSKYYFGTNSIDTDLEKLHTVRMYTHAQSLQRAHVNNWQLRERYCSTGTCINTSFFILHTCHWLLYVQVYECMYIIRCTLICVWRCVCSYSCSYCVLLLVQCEQVNWQTPHLSTLCVAGADVNGADSLRSRWSYFPPARRPTFTRCTRPKHHSLTL